MPAKKTTKKVQSSKRAQMALALQTPKKSTSPKVRYEEPRAQYQVVGPYVGGTDRECVTIGNAVHVKVKGPDDTWVTLEWDPSRRNYIVRASDRCSIELNASNAFSINVIRG